jgi:hypothetical protein
MLIKNTDGSYCKIKEIKVSGLKAYVTLVIYSSVPQTSEDNMGNIHRVFSFYLRDLNSTELYRLSHNNYWIDRNNNYNNDSNNVDINMHKEIILEIDITNNNQAVMQENRWLRRCNIVMIDHTTGADEAWISENLELISKEIELPKLDKFKISYSNKDKVISVDLKLTHKIEEDFNYINENIKTVIEIRSTHTHEVLESLDFGTVENKPESYIYFVSCNEYTEPVIININIENLKGDILQTYSKFFNPLINPVNLTIKDSELIAVKAVSLKESEIKTIKHISTN